jgi:predicted dehydrogenase
MTHYPLKLGIVGAGFFGQVAHIANYAQLDSCQIVALAQLRSDVREQVARKFSIPATYETHHELLAESDAEAIVVVTSRPALGPIVLDCLNAGKHALSEKPMAGSVELAERLVAAADANHVKYAVGYMKRHDAGVQAGKQLLDELRHSRELGAVTYARAHCFAGDAYCGERDYIATQEPRSGGLTRWPMAPAWLPAEQHSAYEAYLNTYCHNINLLRHLMGAEATAVQAHAAGATRLATLDFAGIPALLETGKLEHAGWDEVTEVFFERGRLRIATPAPLRRDTPATVELYRGQTATWEPIEVAP